MHERHAANAINKADRALEAIETDLLWLWETDPDFPEVTDLHTCLQFTHWVLFAGGRVQNPQLSKAVWSILGAFYSINNDYEEYAKVTVFDTSRPFLEANLARRIKETTPRRVDDSDPFVGLHHGPGGNMSGAG